MSKALDGTMAGALKRPPLWQAGLMVASFTALVLRVIQFVQDLVDPGPRWTDFGIYWADAVVARTHGLLASFGQDQCGRLLGGAECRLMLPPASLAPAIPLSFLPLVAAYLVWTAILLVLLVLAWRLTVPRGSALAGAAWLAAFVAWRPTLFGLADGSEAIIVAAAVGIGGALLVRGRPQAAGIVLGLTFLKPQAALLVVPALALGGQWRTAAWTVGVWAAAGGMSLVIMGSAGVHALIANLQWDASVGINADYAPTAGLPAAAAWLLRGMIALAALVAAWRGRRDPIVPLVAGTLGSLLATTYLHPQDLAVLMPLAWLWLAERHVPAWFGGLLLAGYVAGDLPGPGRVPMFLVMGLWLAAILMEDAGWWPKLAPGERQTIPSSQRASSVIRSGVQGGS